MNEDDSIKILSNMLKEDKSEINNDLNIDIIKDNTVCNSEELFISAGINNDIITSSTDEENTIVSSVVTFKLPLRIDDFPTDKEFERFIKSCERIVRMSPEYKLWTSYVRDVLHMECCKITGESINETSVDIHHHPFSLYSIVKGLIYEKLGADEKFCSFDIATECIELHFQMKVPFVSLVSSLHEKFHNGFLKIPMEIVYGKSDYLMDRLFKYLDEEDKATIVERLSINKDNCGWKEGYKWINISEHISDNKTVSFGE